MSAAVATPALLAATLAEERSFVFPSFTHADARRLGQRITDLAEGRGHPVSVQVRRGAQIAFHAGLAGSSAENDDWAARKAASVRRHDRASLALRFEADLQGSGAFAWLDPTAYAVSGGSVPVRLADGLLVGTATVSGLPDSDDHALVVEAIRAHLA
ncbi:heme-degrading domain-containing protein [Curtobacterium sp. RRHDQ10]|uniref:heme-degrading domain-containing protein n=1 Tax=Curtobacterium phyllosphaerae TaxID=3413379 RepID=UPI003BF13EDB